jgi:copper(I)-binding protein
MKITNNMDIDDTLFAVQSNLAKVTKLHETYEKENDMMGMRHVDYLIIPSKSVVELKPGSFHIMLIGLTKDIVEGDSGSLILEFKNAGKVELPVTVRSPAK